MYYLLDKKYDETFTINFIGTEEFQSGDKLTIEMPNCEKGITNILSYTDNTIGETDTVYLDKYFQYKNGTDGEWSELLNIDEISNFDFCENKCLQFNLVYFRVDENGPEDSITITLSNPSIGGEFKFTTNDDPFILDQNNPIQIYNVGDVLKIFSIDSFEVISTAKYGNTFDIKYRFSQDNGLSYTEWELLTQENISTVNWDKLRFVNIQYLFEMKENYVTPVKIYDVILYGDFQNVTANSYKLNMFGLKENCINLYYPGAEIDNSMSGINESLTLDCKGNDSTTCSKIKENSEYQLRMNWLTQGLKCYNPDMGGSTQIDNLEQQNENNSGGFWNPYEFGKITEWHEFLAGTINDMLGFSVDYHRTDPDGNGIDNVVHEYQLHNIVDMKSIKVLVPDNQFPDNQIIINQFNLDLFDTFKINILKSEFKNTFGVQFRPGQEDILYFCQTNRMYIVKHAQIHKDVMNSGIYYNVILEKYEKRSNVINRFEESKNKIEELTRNTTIDDLFGFNKDQDTKQITDKPQLKPKTFDTIRNSINSDIIYNNEEIYNGDVKIMESSLYMANIAENEYSVNYNEQDNDFKKSDNRSFVTWVKFPNLYDPDSAILDDVIDAYDIPTDKVYSIINNYNEDTKMGYKLWYQNGSVFFMINEYIEQVDIDILTNVWYSVVVTLDQRQRVISTNLYRRNSAITVILYNPDTYERIELDYDEDKVDIEYEINSNGFKPVDNQETLSTVGDSIFINMLSQSNDILPCEFTHDNKIAIMGSNMYIANLRIFSDIIKPGDEQIILNQLIIRDTQYLIVADNTEQQIKAENITNKNWR